MEVSAPGPLAVREGAAATYTVALSARPTGDVTIRVSVSGSPEVTVDPDSLTFTGANWNVLQTVTVRAAQDADSLAATADISHAVDAGSSAGEYGDVAIAGVNVTVEDDDPRPLVVVPTPASMATPPPVSAGTPIPMPTPAPTAIIAALPSESSTTGGNGAAPPTPTEPSEDGTPVWVVVSIVAGLAAVLAVGLGIIAILARRRRQRWRRW